MFSMQCDSMQDVLVRTRSMLHWARQQCSSFETLKDASNTSHVASVMAANVIHRMTGAKTRRRNIRGARAYCRPDIV